MHLSCPTKPMIRTAEGPNQQLFLLPTVRELSAVMIDPEINIAMEAITQYRQIVIDSHAQRQTLHCMILYLMLYNFRTAI